MSTGRNWQSLLVANIVCSYMMLKKTDISDMRDEDLKLLARLVRQSSEILEGWGY